PIGLVVHAAGLVEHDQHVDRLGFGVLLTGVAHVVEGFREIRAGLCKIVAAAAAAAASAGGGCGVVAAAVGTAGARRAGRVRAVYTYRRAGARVSIVIVVAAVVGRAAIREAEP